MKAAWKRLKRWSVANLPQLTGKDCPPSTEKQIEKFESAIGATLPKDVRASYRVYNGQCAGTGIVYGLPVMRLQDCLEIWTFWDKEFGDEQRRRATVDFDSGCSSFPDGFVRPVYFNSGWIPVTHDSGGNHIGIDLNPGPKGTRGQVIVFGRDDEFHTVLAPSWGQFLTDLADELEAGNYRLDRTDPDSPAFNPDSPHKKHFHSVGMHWSRGKLGLRRLSAADRKAWRKHGGR